MAYSNPLSTRLALGVDDIKREGKLFRLCADLEAKIRTPVEDVALEWHIARQDLAAQEALAADWRNWEAFDSHTVWARKQAHSWLAAEVVVPEAARGQTFVMRFSSQWQDRPGTTDPQCLLYLDGRIAQGLDGNHTELVIEAEAVPGNRHVVMIDACTFFERPLVGLGVDFFIRNRRIESLYFDLMTPLEVAVRLHQTDARRHAILDLVERSLRALDRRGHHGNGLWDSLPEAEAIAGEIYVLGDTEVQPQVTAVGSTHLDVGWLWRVIHTRDKTARSFATVLRLMEEFPQFVFMYNQSVLFDFLRQDYPELWDRLLARVKSGQFEIEGAMWVEPDVNIVSGESLVRQIMRGKRFHEEHFGVTPKAVWLPDTFGYSANLPQIMEKSGLDYFVTSKLSWNDTDRHPYDTFFWRGIDGSVTKAQLITAQAYESDAIYTTYNGDLSVSETMGAWKRYEPKRANREVIMSYGYGDGGGGPTRAMIERGTRLERGIPGAPKVKLEGILPFLERLGRRMDADPGRFPTWNGELYLQYHRGTLTTWAKNKAKNRLAERRLRELELLGALARTRSDRPYPKETLAEFWDLVLINQFHDILPGTSIPEVYVDSDADYERIFAAHGSADGPWQRAALAVAPLAGGAIRLFNFTSQVRSGLVSLGSGRELWAGTTPDSPSMQQLVRADGTQEMAVSVAGIPALGWADAQMPPAVPPSDAGLSVSASHLENHMLLVRFDANGHLVSVFDKATRREVLKPGSTANRLVAYEDKPMDYEAWDIDAYFEEQFWPLHQAEDIRVVETGPHRVALRVERRYGASRIVQVISLAAGERQVEFDTFIDWQERAQVLKAGFEFDLNVSEVRSEIQFGHVTRPTHRNTSWDRARFEASMHRWVDMSEADFGAALINDCKYGYDAHEQSIRLTLVRGPSYPSPEADRGEHRLRYALMVHAGLSDLALVHQAAERFNNPIGVFASAEGGGGVAVPLSRFGLASVDAANVSIETVKQAEASGALVLRVFEQANRRAEARLTFGLPVRSVRVVNLMEENSGEPLGLDENGVVLSLHPFEIVTLLVEL